MRESQIMKTLYFIAAGNGVLPRLCFRFVRRWVETFWTDDHCTRLHVHKQGFQGSPLFELYPCCFFLIYIVVCECVSSSSQETSARSWNSCNYPWCSSRVGLSSLPHHDSPVSVSCVQQHAGHQVLMSSGFLFFVWSCNHSLLCVWQRYKGRKHLTDGARAGKTSRFWFCLHCLSCQLFCWDSILVCYKTFILKVPLRAHLHICTFFILLSITNDYCAVFAFSGWPQK